MATAVSNSIPLTDNIQIDGLAQGSSWTFGAGPRVIGYSFHQILDFEPLEVWGDVSGLSTQIAGITDALMQWSNVADISFVERLGQPLDGDRTIAELSFTLGGNALDDDGTAGFAYFPDPVFADQLLEEDDDDGTGTGTDEDRTTWPNPEGDIVLDLNGVGGFARGSFGHHVAVHEIGHALGLKHPHDDGANSRPELPFSLDNWRWTVMSYVDPPQSTFTDGNVATPMPLDILAIQHIYGANMSYHTGNDSYVLTDDGIVRTIWDAGGLDTISAAGRTGPTTINLQAGTHSFHGFLSVTAIAFNVTIENAIGGSGNDTITGNAANNVIDGGTGADSMSGGAGDDTYVVENASDTANEGDEAGRDTVLSAIAFTLAGNVEDLTLQGSTDIGGTGNALDNLITGNDGANVLNGAAGNDTLDGGAGSDTLRGGAGNDTYIIGGVQADTIIENPGEGIDTVRSSIGYLLAADLEHLTLTGSADIDGEGNSLDNVLTGNSGINTLRGGSGNDTHVIQDIGDVAIENPNEGIDTLLTPIATALAGSNFENLTLTGAADASATGDGFSNILIGNGGNNVLDGQGGADTMTGGGGNDTYIIDAADTIAEAPGGGTDLVVSPVSYVLGAAFENLVLAGTENLDGTGNESVNALTGNSGNNVLDGRGGADTMTGGEGDDTYRVDNPGDTLVELPDGGIDTVLVNSNYGLAPELENLVLFGAATSGTGNGVDNVLTANVLASTLTGGGGDDTFVLRSAGDVVIEEAGGGEDTVSTRFSYTLIDADVEHLVLTGLAAANATGNEGDNHLTGNAGANVLDGLGGEDWMEGGGGDDTYLVDDGGDTVNEEANAGLDQVFSAVDYALPENVEGLTLIGLGNTNATGNSLNNALTGNAGNNILDGGAGRDVMSGGLGADHYVVGPGDRVIEGQGGGIDTVESAFSYTLPAHVEHLLLTGAGDAQGTGNNLANTLIGNNGDNLLDGGVGADALNGLEGDDVFIFDARDVGVWGGPGEDGLRFMGFNQHLDLTQIGDSVYLGIEAIDLTGRGRNTLTLTADDVLDISDTGTLLVDGSATSRVISTGQAWEQQPNQEIGGTVYRVYEVGGAELLVDAQILLTIS